MWRQIWTQMLVQMRAQMCVQTKRAIWVQIWTQVWTLGPRPWTLRHLANLIRLQCQVRCRSKQLYLSCLHISIIFAAFYFISFPTMENGRWYPYMALRTLQPLPFMTIPDVELSIAYFIGAPEADRRWLSPAPLHHDITAHCFHFMLSSSQFILYRGWVVDQSSWYDLYRFRWGLRPLAPAPAGLEHLPRF